MRYELQLSYANPIQIANLQFNPDELRIINNTSQMLYVRRGSTSNPSPTSFDYAIQPLQIITIPASYTQYAFYLDTTGMLDTTSVCTVIFNSYGSKVYSKNPLLRSEFLLKPDMSLQQVSLDFSPRVMIVVNNSDGNLYVRRGSQSHISSESYDYLILAKTAISIPVSGIEFNLLLSNSTEYSCLVVFVDDYRFSVNTIPATKPEQPIIPIDVTVDFTGDYVGLEQFNFISGFGVGETDGFGLAVFPSGSNYAWFWLVFSFNQTFTIHRATMIYDTGTDLMNGYAWFYPFTDRDNSDGIYTDGSIGTDITIEVDFTPFNCNGFEVYFEQTPDTTGFNSTRLKSIRLEGFSRGEIF